MTNQKMWPPCNMIHNDLILAKELLYDKCNFKCSYPLIELESSEYGACTFELNSLSIKYRVAKITPTKIGQFVTIWKRTANGPIEPHSSSDLIDLFIISTRKDNFFGHFIFPKSALSKYGIITNNEKEGKRGFRVYPPWDKTTSKQAQATQKWQLNFFLEIPIDTEINLERSKMLYQATHKDHKPCF